MAETSKAATPPRMRTKDKAIAQIKADDPDTSFTRAALDRLVREGKLPAVRIGNKSLINYDLLLEVMTQGAYDETRQDDQSGAIRRIDV